MDSYIFEIVLLLSAVVLILVLAMFALARQIGVLHTRLAPAGATQSPAYCCPHYDSYGKNSNPSQRTVRST